MKNLKYKKEKCILCNGEGRIVISPNDLVVCFKGKLEDCRLCHGRGYLNIINIEKTNDL